MDEKEIIKLYTVDKMTLRMIAEMMNTNHHRIKRILVSHDIEITREGRKRKPFTEEHRKKISEATKGRKVWAEGKKMTREHVLKNMVAHIKYEVDVNFYEEFEEIEKLKCLNRMLVRDRINKYFNTEKYKEFIKKFYYDKQFNQVYQIWIESNKDKWAKPSLDHIQPISKGGTHDLDNMQILTWFENRTKCDMEQTEWEIFKQETNTKSTYFL
jgi:hypothetical protein